MSPKMVQHQFLKKYSIVNTLKKKKTELRQFVLINNTHGK